MKKNTTIIGILFIVLLSFTFNFKVSIATGNGISINDYDEDGIDDNFEKYNIRDIEVNLEPEEIAINSLRREDPEKDQIKTTIIYDNDGIQFEIHYTPSIKSEFNLTYRMIYRELIEYVDIDHDGIYNPEIDLNIQNVSLKDFSPATYEKSDISSDTELHRITIQTVNETFLLHIFLAEEFTYVEDSLITPAQIRIDIEILDFDYVNDSSQLALNIRLESEEVFQYQEETEDEEYKFAVNEQGIITSLNKINGYITWSEYGIIDSVLNTILLSDLSEDDISETSQKIYINYQRGNHSYHLSKLGIEGLLEKEPFSLMNLVVILLIIGAVSAFAVYSIHLYKKDQIKKSSEQKQLRSVSKLQKREIENLFNSKLALKLLIEGIDLEPLYTGGDTNLTVISEDFYETVNRLGLKRRDRDEFIREMLSLPPYEREQFLRDLLIQMQ